MLIIKYTPSGSRISDAGAEAWAMLKAQEYLELEGNSDLTISIANSNVYDCFRVLVLDGVLEYDEIELHADGLVYTMNEHASMPAWPPNMGEYHMQMLTRILTHRGHARKMEEIRKKDREKKLATKPAPLS